MASIPQRAVRTGRFAPVSGGPGTRENRQYQVRGRLHMHVEGVPRLRRRVQLAQAQGPMRLIAMLDDTLEDVFEVSQQLVPLDLGPLQESGRIVWENIGGGRSGGSIVYGNADLPYAVIQHENLAYAHAPGRQAKYVEQPMNEAAAALPGKLKAGLSNLFELT